MMCDLQHPVDSVAGKSTRSALDLLLQRSSGLAALCLLTSIWISPAQAALPDGLAACRAIAGDSQRLACYDALSQAATASSAPSGVAPPPAATSTATPAPAAPALVAPAVASAAATAPAATVERNFGVETVTKSFEGEPQRLTAKVVGDLDGIPRRTVFHLDNGQVWQSIDDNEYVYEADNPKLTIDRNFAGSYWMHLENAHFNVRVSRVQ